MRHVEKEIARIVDDYSDGGLAAVCICSNDVEQEPEDTPNGLREQIERVGFNFPYLIDESQAVAKAYKTACTPDFYLFDRDRKLVYRGRMDASRPRNEEPVNGEDLRNGIEAVLGGRQVTIVRRPASGVRSPGSRETSPAETRRASR